MRTDMNLEQKDGTTVAIQDVLNHCELGSDTFIVRDRKIVTQTFAGKISPKRREQV